MRRSETIKNSSDKERDEIESKLEGFELFQNDDGTLGAYLPYYGQNGIKYLEDWKDEDRDIHEVLSTYIDEYVDRWPLPGCPDINAIDGVYEDLTDIIQHHIWLQDDRLYRVLANCTICSYIQEHFDNFPRLIFYGTTRSGKTRALQTMQELCYRGMDLLGPTPAALFRLIEKYHVSAFIDEYQDISKDRVEEISMICKGGFGRTKVPRVAPDNGGLEFFDVFGPMAIGIKNGLPPDDIQNRSLIINMIEKPKEVNIRRRIDRENARQLRGRLLAFKIKMTKLEPEKIPTLLEQAESIAESPIIIQGRKYELDDRSIEIATTLLVPSLMYGDVDDVLGVMVDSQMVADQGLSESFEAKVYYALEEVFERHDPPAIKIKGKAGHDVSNITTRAVADQLNYNLEMEGNTGRENVKTKRVTTALKAMGFTIRTGGTGNLSRFCNETFQKAFEAAGQKYHREGY